MRTGLAYARFYVFNKNFGTNSMGICFVAGDGSLMDQIYVSSIICPYYLISLSHPSVTDLYIRGVYIPYTKGSVNSSES